MNMNMVANIAGQNISTISNEQYDFDLTVKSITKEGNFVFESQYTRIYEKNAELDKITYYDSDAKNADAVSNTKASAGLFDKVIGKTFLITMSPKGKILDISGVKKILSSLKLSKADSVSYKMIEKAFSEKTIKTNLGSVCPTFPDAPVKVGDTWAETDTSELVEYVDSNLTYKLNDVQQGIAKISTECRVKIRNGNFSAGDVEMKMKINGKLSATFDLDTQTGLIRNATFSIPMEGNIEVVGMDFPVTVNTILQTSTSAVN